MDGLGRWLELHRASSFLVAYRVEGVTTLQLDSGFTAVSTKMAHARRRESGDSGGGSLTVRMLYKDWKYCMNHMFSRKKAIL